MVEMVDATTEFMTSLTKYVLTKKRCKLYIDRYLRYLRKKEKNTLNKSKREKKRDIDGRKG